MEIKVGMKVEIIDTKCCNSRLHNNVGIVKSLNNKIGINVEDEKGLDQYSCSKCTKEYFDH